MVKMWAEKTSVIKEVFPERSTSKHKICIFYNRNTDMLTFSFKTANNTLTESVALKDVDKAFLESLRERIKAINDGKLPGRDTVIWEESVRKMIQKYEKYEM